MNKVKKVLLIAMSMILVSAVSVGATLALLADTDKAVNYQTTGLAQIEQIELQRVDMNHQAQKTPAEFENYKSSRLYPAVNTNGGAYNDPSVWWPGVAADEAYVNYGTIVDADIPTGPHWTGVWDKTLKNVKDKMVFVKNTGDVDVYYRTIILYEYDETEKTNSYGQGMIHFNTNGNARFDWYVGEDEALYTNAPATVTVNGEKYGVMVATYNKALLPGTTSRPSLIQFGLDAEADNEVVEQFGEVYDILVLSQAVQTEGFTEYSNPAHVALNAEFGEINTDNIISWFTGMETPEPADTAEKLTETLADGKDVVLTDDIAATTSNSGYGVGYVNVNGSTLNGNGNTLSVDGSGDYTAITTTGGTIENMGIDDGFRAIFLENMTEDVYLTDLKIGGDGVCYSINTGANTGEYSMIVENCQINGWSSFAQIKSASFTNCAFGQGGYSDGEDGRLLKPYVNTTVTDCTFIDKYYLDLSSLEAGCKVTFKDCTINGVALTADVCESSNDCDYYDLEKKYVCRVAQRQNPC